MAISGDERSGGPCGQTVGSGELTRREALARLGAGAFGLAVFGALPAESLAAGGEGAASGAGPTGVAVALGGTPPKATPFRLADVRLLPGPFLEAQARDLRYLMFLEPDRMLHNFRVNAGLQPKAPVYGGWESEEPWVDIRCHGHTLGHYLSAAAMMYAATGDDRMKQRIDYIVGELAECQNAAGAGLVCAFPDGATQLENIVAGRPTIGVPWYTMHKIFAGLRDAHVFAESSQALEVLRRLADWAVAFTANVPEDGFQRMLDREHGGMNEVLADVSALTGDRRYLELATRFCHQRVLAPLSAGEDRLDGLHANTQIPKIVGFERLHQLTGDDSYGRAAGFFWRTVTERRSFATGGHGDQEHFFPPAEFAKHIQSAKTMETCCTHNMLRLSRMLFESEPSAALMDFYERALFNGILASQDPDTGMMTYFQATRPGYVRLFHTPDRSFWCCTGTGMENHAKYGDTIYSRGQDALFVNLFIPSRLTWEEKGLTLTQTTTFPDSEHTRLSIAAARPVRATVHVRQPAWCRGMTVKVNGRTVAAAAAADGYVPVDRVWRSGDRLDVRLPMDLRLEPLPGTIDWVAFAYGPIVLAGRMGREGLASGNQIIVNERESGNMLNAAVQVPVLVGSPDAVLRNVVKARERLSFRTSGVGRPTDIELAPYYRLAHERYNLYWKIESA